MVQPFLCDEVLVNYHATTRDIYKHRTVVGRKGIVYQLLGKLIEDFFLALCRHELYDLNLW